MLYPSPLRYPGGKRRLTNFMKVLIAQNGLIGGTYLEPYAGGAAVALSLLYEEYVRSIVLNDLNRSVYAFWSAALNHTDALCQRISDTAVTIDEWHRQRQVQDAECPDVIDLGFSTFFLNRANRSGIIRGGPIGGREQEGMWGLDARFNKADLVKRIQKVGRFAGRIRLYNMDAHQFLTHLEEQPNSRRLVYLDPPYFQKGADLYENHYTIEDHASIALLVRSASYHWVVSYDDHAEIAGLYSQFKYLSYGINYSAQGRYRGAERMFFCDSLQVPSIGDPVCLPRSELVRLTEGVNSALASGTPQ